MRAAANSIASGNPSTLRQISTTTSRAAPFTAAALTARARSRKSCTAGLSSRRLAEVWSFDRGRSNGATASSCSPRMRSGARLVARICIAGQRARSGTTKSATAMTRCSQLSSNSSDCRERRWRTSCSLIGTLLTGTTPSALATVSGTRPATPSGARSIQITPSANDGATWAATAIAKRVLPTPPGPVSVSSGTASSRKRPPASARSASRPMSRVRGTGAAV
jgi:hypothetical protein